MNKQHRPSLGFVLAVSSYLLLGVFFAWGWASPELATVQTVYEQLYSGAQALDAATVQPLARSLRRHPEIASAWLDQQPWRVVTPVRNGVLQTPSALILRDPKAAGRIWASAPATTVVQWGELGQTGESLTLGAQAQPLPTSSAAIAWHLQAPARAPITLTWKEPQP
jgi:hypothetical protein